MNISPTKLAIILSLISTGSLLLGIIVTQFFNLRIARITKESEERKHQKEVVVKAAIENWKHTYELMKTSGLPNKSMSPFDVFLVHMIVLCDAVFDPTMNADNLKQRLGEVDKMTAIVSSSIEDIKPRA